MTLEIPGELRDMSFVKNENVSDVYEPIDDSKKDKDYVVESISSDSEGNNSDGEDNSNLDN